MTQDSGVPQTYLSIGPTAAVFFFNISLLESINTTLVHVFNY